MKRLCRKLAVLLLTGAILSWVGDGSEELVRESYEEYDGGEYIIFRPATTRKLKIVPPLTKVLENRDP